MADNDSESWAEAFFRGPNFKERIEEFFRGDATTRARAEAAIRQPFTPADLLPRRKPAPSSEATTETPREPATRRSSGAIGKRKGGRRKRTAEQWEPIWETARQYYAGGVSQEDFCKGRKIGVRTLQHWLRDLEGRDPDRLAELRRRADWE